MVDQAKGVIALLSEATAILTGGGRLLAVNSATVRLLGSPSDKIEGQLLQSFVTSPTADLLTYLRSCSRSKQVLVGAVVLQTREGDQPFTTKGALLAPRTEVCEPCILLRLFPRLEANARFSALKKQIDILNLEVANRMRAERNLRTQKEWLQVTLSSIGDAVITTDTECYIAFMNPVAEALTGWSTEEAAGKRLSEVFIIVDEFTREPVENPAEKALREARIVALANHTVLIAKSGDEIFIEDTAAPIMLNDEVKGTVLVFHDVSDKRYLQKQLIERADRLELSNRRKSEFLVMLAHELRGPLAPINNAVKLIEMEEADSQDSEEARLIISRQVQHLTRLVDDMLDVSRITRGKVNIAKQSVDFSLLVRLAVQDFKPQFSEAGIKFTCAVPRKSCWVSGDPDRLTQVLHNLFINSKKFTPAAGSVHVSVECREDMTVLRIVDTGLGIEESLMPDLFEPFTQAAQSLDRSSGGLGIGLSLVKGIIDLHQGTIEVSSAGVGKGTSITISLPLIKPCQEPANLEVETPAVLISSRTILLIEDDIDAATTMRRLLELLGHQVHVAHTGQEGLDKAMQILPEVIFCDIGLPVLDGFSVAKRLRSHAKTASIPLIALTGYGSSEFVERAIQAGFNHHLVKPARLDDIQKAMESRKVPD